MAQARALNAAEMEEVLTHVNAGRHAHRNRCFILLTHLAGMRVGEVASLRWVDVLTADGHIKEEIRLSMGCRWPLEQLSFLGFWLQSSCFTLSP